MHRRRLILDRSNARMTIGSWDGFMVSPGGLARRRQRQALIASAFLHGVYCEMSTEVGPHARPRCPLPSERLRLTEPERSVTPSKGLSPMSLPLLQAALADAIDEPGAPVAGPLTVLIDSSSTSPGRNYAAPVRLEAPTPDDIATVVTLMRAAGRMPRLEFVAPHPELEHALLEAGFRINRRIALLMLGELAGAPVPAGIGVSAHPSDADLLGAAETQNAAYGDPEPARVTAQRLRHNVALGGVTVVATDVQSGEIVGSGLATPPRGGLSEIAAVAVRAAFRRRGIAAAMTAELCRHVRAAGAEPFLQAEPAEVTLYERLGFTQVGRLAVAELPG